MKKINKLISVLLVALMLVTSAPLAGFVGLELPKLSLSASAADSNGENLKYTVSNGEAILSSYQSVSGALVIPETLGGYPVKRISNYAFNNCSGLTSVTIPNSVTSIGNYAFRGCTSLTDVTIPDSVTSIGNYAFEDCTSLKNVYITDIESWCKIDFGSYSSNPMSYASKLYLNGEPITELVIPDGITKISPYLFSSNTITTVTIPNSVTSIGNYAFEDCTSLKNVYITDIESWCKIDFGSYSSNPMSYASKLYLNGEPITELVIPDGITKIKSYAFLNCKSITTVTIPNSVTSIGYEAFRGCIRLVDVTIPGSVTSIGGYAFDNCTSLTDVTIPDSVTSIGNYAFRGCTSLTDVTIPDSVTSIDSNAFDNCTSLKNVYITDLESWCKIDFEDYYSNPMRYAGKLYLNAEQLTEIVIPEGIEKIGSYALAYSGNLISGSISIPGSVTSIGYGAFYENRNITAVTIPETVEKIGDNAFAKSVVIYGKPGSAAEDYAIKFGNTFVSTDEHTHEYKEKTIKEPTCTKEGTKKYYCSCGDTFTKTIPALGHDLIEEVAVPATCVSSGLSAGKRCSRCDYEEAQSVIPALGHDIVKDKAVPATCIQDGLTEGEHCTRCDYELAQEVIPATGHTKVVDSAVAPTCTKSGLTQGSHCSVCGEVFEKQEEIPALGHTVVVEPGVAPTCTKPGLTQGSHCSVCGEVFEKQEAIPALGHNIVKDAGKSATCTETGLTEGEHCTRCDYELAQEVIPATGHHFSRWVVSSEPTCTVNGKQIRICACGEIEEEVIPSLGGHTDGDGDGVCDRCGESMSGSSASTDDSPITLVNKLAKWFRDLIEKIVNFFRSIGDRT